MGQTQGKLRPESSTLEFESDKIIDEDGLLTTIPQHDLDLEQTLRHVSDDGGDGYVPVDLDVTAKALTVPTIFTWEYGSKEVYVSGTFNEWKTRVPLAYSGGEFAAIIDLPSGTHYFKYLVDGNWVHDPNQKTVDDQFGGRNNVINVNESDFDPTQALLNDECGANIPHGASTTSLSRLSPPGSYNQLVPDHSYNQTPWKKAPTQPPTLPPHLLDVILNNEADNEDPILLPIPNHVALNHLYALSIKDNVMTLSSTHRYKKKYITTIMYRPIE